MQVLKWAVENGCPWDKRVRDFMPGGACGFMALHQVRTWVDGFGIERFDIERFDRSIRLST